MPIRTRFKAFIQHERFTLYLLLLAALIMAPSLWQGFHVDDKVHRALFLKLGVYADHPGHPIMDMFSFVKEDVTPLKPQIDNGIMPWWSVKGLSLSFWRPITAITHWLDYQLWPDSPFAMHLHNLLWFLLLIGAISYFYKRFLPGTWAAGLAIYLYAVNSSFGMPVAWIANRNALICTFFGVFTLIFYDRWRKENWLPGAFLAPLSLLIALFAKEGGIAVCAYLFAYACFLEKGTLQEKFLPLFPYAAVVIGWRLVYRSYGYELKGSGLYVDPLAEPISFIFAVLEKAPLLLMGQWAFPSPELWILLPRTGQLLMVLWAVCILAIVFVILRPMWLDPKAKFWITGILLSVIPICATFPHTRLLFFVAIGGLGLLAQFLVGMWEGASWKLSSPGWQKLARIGAYGFVILHIVLSPLLLQTKFLMLHRMEQIAQQTSDSLKVKEAHKEHTYVVLNSPEPFLSLTIPIRKHVHKQVTPKILRILASGATAIQVSTADAHTLVLRPKRCFFHNFDLLFRKPTDRMKVGDVIRVPGMKITINALCKDGRPKQVSFRFSEPLHSKKLHFFQGEDGGTYKPIKLPPKGKSVMLAPLAFP